MLFMAILKYVRPLDVVDQILPAHRQYLSRLIDSGKLLVAGRLNPRTGGVIIAKNISRAEFEIVLKEDPLSQVFEAQILEFDPSYYDPSLNELLNPKRREKTDS